MEKSKEVKRKIQETEEKEKDVIKRRDAILVTIGNLVHDSVVVDQDEVGTAA
jgi:seryl-tRNA synthetase